MRLRYRRLMMRIQALLQETENADEHSAELEAATLCLLRHPHAILRAVHRARIDCRASDARRP